MDNGIKSWNVIQCIDKCTILSTLHLPSPIWPQISHYTRDTKLLICELRLWPGPLPQSKTNIRIYAIIWIILNEYIRIRKYWDSNNMSNIFSYSFIAFSYLEFIRILIRPNIRKLNIFEHSFTQHDSRRIYSDINLAL